MADSKQYDLSVIFRVLDRASGTLEKIGRKFRNLTEPLDRVDLKMQQFQQRMQRLSTTVHSVGQNIALKLSLPLGIALGIATKKSMSFQDAWTGVRKTVEASEPELAALKKELMGMARVIPISTEDIMKIGEIAGQMNLSVSEIAGFTKVIADLAATTDMTAETGARMLGEFANITKMPKTPEMFERLGATINYLGAKTEATEGPIAEMAQRIASAGMRAKMTYAEIVSVSAALTSLGLNAEMGGTAYSRFIREIIGEMGTASNKIRLFAYVAGYKSVKDFEKAWKVNAAQAQIKFLEGLAKMEAAGKNTEKVLDKLGLGGVLISDTLSRAALSGGYFNKIIEWGNEEWERHNSLLLETIQRYGTTTSKMIMTRNAAEQMASTFGDEVRPVLESFAEELKPVWKWLEALDSTTKKIILGFTALGIVLGPVIMIVGSFISLLAIAFGKSVIGSVLLYLGAIGFAILGFGAGLLTVIYYWKDLKQAFSEDFWGSVGDMIQVAIGKLVNLLSWLTGGIIPNFEKWRNLVSSIWSFFKSPIQSWKKWMGEEGLGQDKTSNRQHWGQAMVLSAQQMPRSETDINIRITSDPGATATIEDVKKKKGDASVNASSIGYVGAY